MWHEVLYGAAWTHSTLHDMIHANCDLNGSCARKHMSGAYTYGYVVVAYRTLKYHDMIDANAGFYGQYLERKTLALTLLFFIPVIFQVRWWWWW